MIDDAYRTEPCTHPVWLYEEAGISRCSGCGRIQYNADHHVEDQRGAIALLTGQFADARARIAELEAERDEARADQSICCEFCGLGDDCPWR